MLTEASIKRPAVNPDLSASTAEIAAVPLTFLIEIRTLGAQCVDLKRSTRGERTSQQSHLHARKTAIYDSI